jgi:hypothetical protein
MVVQVPPDALADTRIEAMSAPGMTMPGNRRNTVSAVGDADEGMSAVRLIEPAELRTGWDQTELAVAAENVRVLVEM